MDLEFTPEQEELGAQVRAVLRRECPISLVREIVEKGKTADDLWARMVELDWPALSIAEADGGLGGSFLDLAVVVEELGMVMAPGPFLPTVSQFVPVVRELGTTEQRQRFLGAVASGSLTGTVALADSGRSWDGTALTARPSDGGWVLSGSKHNVVEGGAVDEIAVVGTDENGAVAVFVVPSSSADATAVRSLDASRQLARVSFDGVEVAAERRLGRTGDDARPGLDRALQEATVSLALETVGTCQTIFDIALEYAKDRKQFGVPIGSFQAMKHKFANMFIALQRARATAYFAAATIAEEDDRRAVAAAMAKSAAGDCQELLAQEGVQSLGGIGYTWEHDMHLYVKRAKSSGFLFGDARSHRTKVAQAVGLS